MELWRISKNECRRCKAKQKPKGADGSRAFSKRKTNGAEGKPNGRKFANLSGKRTENTASGAACGAAKRRGDSCFAALRPERSRFFQGEKKSEIAFFLMKSGVRDFFARRFPKFFQIFQKNSPAPPVAPARRAQGFLSFFCGIFHFFLPAHSTLSSLAGKGLFPWN